MLVLQWWTGAVLHSYLRLAHAVHRYGGRVVIEWHEVQDTGEARIPGRHPLRDRPRMKQLLKRVDGHVVHSQYDLELLRRTYPLPDELVVIAPHGPYNQYDTAGDGTERTGDFVFLYFGVIRPYKGVEDLVAAFERLPEAVRATSRLVIVGETWEGWTAPLDAVAASPVKDRITVVNRYVDDAEVAEHFAAADAVVLPYRRSSSSGPLHIAMSAGLPVVVASVGGLVEAAGDYTGVTFVPTQDPGCARRRRWRRCPPAAASASTTRTAGTARSTPTATCSTRLGLPGLDSSPPRRARAPRRLSPSIAPAVPNLHRPSREPSTHPDDRGRDRHPRRRRRLRRPADDAGARRGLWRACSRPASAASPGSARRWSAPRRSRACSGCCSGRSPPGSS